MACLFNLNRYLPRKDYRQPVATSDVLSDNKKNVNSVDFLCLFLWICASYGVITSVINEGCH